MRVFASVVAKVAHHAGELFPRAGFIVTNLILPSRGVARFYNKRGTAEQRIAATFIAAANWELVADEPAAAVGEDRLSAGEACPLLLPALGGKPSDTAADWSHSGHVCDPIFSSGDVAPPTERITSEEQAGGGKVSEDLVDREAGSDFGSLNTGEIGPFRPRWKLRMRKTQLAIAFVGGQLYGGGQRESKKEIPDHLKITLTKKGVT